MPAGPALHGEIDWARRFDHMQQHSGQHLLSAVALEQMGANTLSFHLGEEVVTIDLDVPEIAADAALALENEANRLVFSDLPVRAYFVAPGDVAGLNLRKLPTKGEQTRIVEIVGVDRSPCGGTHVSATGQIGLIKLRRTERYKGGTRVEFLCGWRALRDYQWKHQAIAALARDLSVADREAEAAVRRALAGEREAERQVEQLRSQLVAYEAAAMRAAAVRIGDTAVIAQALSGRPAAEVKQLASALAAQPGTVALLAATAPAVRLFFMRSPDVPADMRGLLHSVTQACGGGGGGRPETAEGGGLPEASVARALALAVAQLQAQLAR
jgi:alanyl-tRNA synthetase